MSFHGYSSLYLFLPAQHGGTVMRVIFMPHSCHKALAITGAIAITSNSVIDGTVTRSLTTDHGYGNITIGIPAAVADIHLK